MKKHVNKNNIVLLLILLVVALFIVSLVIVFKKSSPLVFTNKTGSSQSASKKQLVFEADKYKTLVRDLFTRLTPDNPSAAKDVKQQLLGITVSKEFKEIHFNLVMASSSLENYSLSRDEKSLDQAKTLLAKLKKDYPWLTDKSL